MRVLNLGSLNLDRTYEVPHFVGPGETVLSTGYRTSCGGKGLNQSVALARAGAEVFHAGAVGEDGGALWDLLASAGVDLSRLRRLAGPSGHAVIQLTPAGENCILVSGGANAAVTGELVDAALAGFGAGDVLLLQNEVSCVDYAIRRGRAQGMEVALNPSPINDALLRCPLEQVDLFLLNEVEGRALAGGEGDRDILERLARRFPGAAIVLTVGERGAWYQRDGETLHQPIFPVAVADTTAAGDTFCGFFLAALGRGCAPARALEMASRASALAVSRPGAADSIPTWDEAAAFGG
ncbi:MAG TPA: ribokinase [Candidatus Galloscillospira excrementavium]|nr:ribokinase [Candidatus Galloscillospira excrementavium]